MRTFKWLSFAFIFLWIMSCGKSVPNLDGIDADSWKNDRNGCSNKRSAMIETIRKEKEKLLALDEVQVIKVLGKPDRNELFKRNQKFYHYYLEPSEGCLNAVDTPLRLSIRFNAMGLAKEIVIE